MKKVLAVLLALSFVFAFAACKGKGGDETTAAPDTTVAAGEEDTTAAAGDETTAAAGEDTTAAAGDETTAAAGDETTAAGDTTAPAAGTTAAGSTAPAGTTKPAAGTTAAGTKVPSTTAEIVKLYNDAVNKAVSAKAGYTKTRYTKKPDVDLGAIAKIVKDADEVIFGFLKIGTVDYSQKKGSADVATHLAKSTLAAGDVKSATCKLNGANYEITMTLNNGVTNHGSATKAPVDKTGIYVGAGDKSAYDHKTAQNYKAAIDGSGVVNVGTVKETSSNVKVTAVVEAATGKIVSMSISFDTMADMTAIKAGPITVWKEKSAGTHSDVKYSKFVW